MSKKTLVSAAAPLGLIFAVSLVGCGGGTDTASTEPSTEQSVPAAEAPADPAAPESEAPAAPAEPAITYPGQTDSDMVGNVGDTLDVDNVAVTASPMRVSSSVFGEITCTDVTLVNNDDDTLSFSSFSFSLQNPQGAAVNSGFSTEEGATALPTGELAAGGTATGQVCFDGAATAGQNVLLYAPYADFTTDRGAWVQTV